MPLEPRIFLLAAALVALAGSAAFFAEWQRNRTADALAWWSGGLASAATGLTLFAVGGDEVDSVARMFGNYANLGAAGALLCAARRLHGLSANLLALVAGPIIWLGVSAKLGSDFSGRVIVIAILQAGYAITTGIVMWRGGRLRAPEYRLVAILMFVVGGLQIVRAVAGRSLVGQPIDPGLNGQWVIPTAVVAGCYAAALAVLVLRGFRKAGQLPDSDRRSVAGSRSRQLP